MGVSEKREREQASMLSSSGAPLPESDGDCARNGHLAEQPSSKTAGVMNGAVPSETVDFDDMVDTILPCSSEPGCTMLALRLQPGPAAPSAAADALAPLSVAATTPNINAAVLQPTPQRLLAASTDREGVHVALASSQQHGSGTDAVELESTRDCKESYNFMVAGLELDMAVAFMRFHTASGSLAISPKIKADSAVTTLSASAESAVALRHADCKVTYNFSLSGTTLKHAMALMSLSSTLDGPRRSPEIGVDVASPLTHTGL